MDVILATKVVAFSFFIIDEIWYTRLMYTASGMLSIFSSLRIPQTERGSYARCADEMIVVSCCFFVPIGYHRPTGTVQCVQVCEFVCVCLLADSLLLLLLCLEKEYFVYGKHCMHDMYIVAFFNFK